MSQSSDLAHTMHQAAVTSLSISSSSPRSQQADDCAINPQGRRAVAVIIPASKILSFDPTATRSALDLSLTSTEAANRTWASISTTPGMTLPDTRARHRSRKPLQAILFRDPSLYPGEHPDVDILDELWEEDQNLGLMFRNDGTLEQYQNRSTLPESPRPAPWITYAAQSVARVWMGRSSHDNVHKGTATHIGKGYFLTAAHVLRFTGLDLLSLEQHRVLPHVNELQMSLIRPVTGHDPICAPEVQGHRTRSMRFEIVAFCRTVHEDMKEYHPFYSSIREHYVKSGFSGLLPLPLDYVVPKTSDLALIRVLKRDRKIVKTSFALPGRVQDTSPSGDVSWIGINGTMTEADCQFFPTIADQRDRINRDTLRANHVSYFGAPGQELEPILRQSLEHVSLRFHSSKGASGSGLFCQCKKGKVGGSFQLLGILQAGLRPAGVARPNDANAKAKVVFATWEHPELKAFIETEIIPRFRRSSTVLQRLRNREANTISEAWQDIIR